MRLPRRLRALAVVPVLIASAAAAVSVVAVSPAAAANRALMPSWTQYHGGAYRSGYAKSMPNYTGGLHVVKQIALDGAVYAQPIVANGLEIVATENNTVYAFNSSNKLVWKHHFGAPSPANQRPCGNIDPLGITGTPLYDSANKTVYVAPEFSASPPTHRLYGLSITNGAVRLSRSLDYAGVDRTVMQERGALAFAHGRVWVPFGGLAGDCGSYKGRVVGIPVGGGAGKVFTVPTDREAGIWTPPGPTVDPDGNLFVAVGNGASGVGDKYDYSDSILKIGGVRAHRLDSFSPSSWPTDNDNDLDLGSQGPAFVSGWVFSAGKSGNAYVLRRNHLGGVGGAVSHGQVCKSFGGTAVIGNTVFVPCTDGVRAVYIDSKGKMHLGWHNGSASGSPVYGGGIIWTLDTSNGVLRGIGVHDGARHVGVTVGSVSRFATPAISGRRILVGTLSGLTVLAF